MVFFVGFSVLGSISTILVNKLICQHFALLLSVSLLSFSFFLLAHITLLHNELILWIKRFVGTLAFPQTFSVMTLLNR
jgi:hypothetical protein